MSVRVARVDVFDDAGLAAWHASSVSTQKHDRLDPVFWPLGELTAAYRDPSSTYRHLLFAAIEDGTMLGTANVGLPLRDNLTLCEADVQVCPEHRRRGIGTALYEALSDACRSDGRKSAMAGVVGPYPEAGAPTPPGVPFAERHGFTRRNAEVRRRLRLPIPLKHLDEFLDGTAPCRAAYRLESWEGRCPERYAEQYAQLQGLLAVEAPTGDLEFEQEVYDVERLRNDENRLVAMGQRWFTTVAVAPDGTLAGHTQLGVPSEIQDADNAYQWATLILRAHRGHRLGLAVKALNHRAAQKAIPGLRRSINTWNAEQNKWMISVNEALGYEPVDLYMEFQGDL